MLRCDNGFLFVTNVTNVTIWYIRGRCGVLHIAVRGIHHVRAPAPELRGVRVQREPHHISLNIQARQAYTPPRLLIPQSPKVVM